MMTQLIPFIFLAPLTAFPVILFFGRYLPIRGALVGIGAIAFSFLSSLCLLGGALKGTLALPYTLSFPWFRLGSLDFAVGIYADGLTLVMLGVVTLVSLLVQIYSLGYMRGDPRFKRYYAYLSLFTASMLCLVRSEEH